MTQQSMAANRGVDPITTKYARGFSQMPMAGFALFPRAEVETYGGKTVVFDDDHFVPSNSKRSSGSRVQSVQVAWGTDAYNIDERSQDALTSGAQQKDAQVTPGLNKLKVSLGLVIKKINLETEVWQATLARNAALYPVGNVITLAGASKWTVSGSNPGVNIRAAKEQVRKQVGVYPNTMVLSATAMAALQENTFMTDKTKYTSKDSITTDIIAAMYGFTTVMIGGALQKDILTGVKSDVWGDDVVIAYVAQAENTVDGMLMGDHMEPSYGWTYTVSGQPVVGETYWDSSRRSWVSPYDDHCKPLLVGALAGVLIQNAGTP